MQESVHSPPQARDHGLVCRDLPDGLMVYDEERHQAHSLNPTAAFVWRHCDGQTAIPELAHRMQQELDLPADEAMVWLALDRLEKAHLLHGPLARPEDPGHYSRRAMIQKLGKMGVAAALVPLITSIASPKAHAQASPNANPGSAVGGCAGKTAGAACTTAAGKAGTCKEAGKSGVLVCT
jgi:hypothetical protein